MKNTTWNDAIKMMTPKKRDWLVIQYTDEVYTMSINGHVALRLEPWTYSTVFHQSKPFVFPLLEPGQAIRNGEPVEPYQFNEIFKHYDAGALPEVKRTPWSLDIKTGVRPGVLRVYIANGQAVYINAGYSDPFGFADNWQGAGGTTPVFGDIGTGANTICLLPVRPPEGFDPSEVGQALEDINIA